MLRFFWGFTFLFSCSSAWAISPKWIECPLRNGAIRIMNMPPHSYPANFFPFPRAYVTPAKGTLSQKIEIPQELMPEVSRIYKNFQYFKRDGDISSQEAGRAEGVDRFEALRWVIRKTTKQEIALRLLKQGLSDSGIRDAVGLTVEDLEDLKSK